MRTPQLHKSRLPACGLDSDTDRGGQDKTRKNDSFQISSFERSEQRIVRFASSSPSSSSPLSVAWILYSILIPHLSSEETHPRFNAPQGKSGPELQLTL